MNHCRSFSFVSIVLRILEKEPALRVPYFFTICAIIFDVICGLNYIPFIEKGAIIHNMVEQLERIVRENDLSEWIYGKGANDRI